jgi:acetolactate synthase I/II/III large subunit
MLSPWTPPAAPREVPLPPRTRAAEGEVERVARLLAAAQNPVILCDGAGRDPQAFAALVQFAEALGAPVGSRHCAYANFPKSHPLFLGQGIQPFVKDADLVLLVDCKAPWYPPSRKPGAGTVVAIDANPLKATMAYQSLQADHYLEGDVAAALQLLAAALPADGKSRERRERWRSEHERLVAAERAAESGAATGERIDPLALAGALRAAMPADTVYVEETITHAGMLQQHLPWDRPQSFFRPGGGLGQGLGMALGVKLALKDRPVAALLGDGSFLYNPVVQAFGAGKSYDLPILVVVFDNGQYRAMQTGHLHHYPDGVARDADMWHGVHIDAPDYGELGKPFGFHGERVARPAELQPALTRALKSVADGRSAILDVVLSR